MKPFKGSFYIPEFIEKLKKLFSAVDFFEFQFSLKIKNKQILQFWLELHKLNSKKEILERFESWVFIGNSENQIKSLCDFAIKVTASYKDETIESSVYRFKS